MHEVAAAAIIAVLASALAGCSVSDSQPEQTGTAVVSPVESATSPPSTSEPVSPSPDAQQTDDSHDAIGIEIEGDRITPNGERVEVSAGGHVLLEIESDRAGELHVHSSPEQELPFPRGESTVELTIDRPGVVDVEEHESGVIIVQLEVS